MNRRQFNLLLAAGSLGLPRAAWAAAKNAGELIELPPAPIEITLEHWRVVENSTLRWFEKSLFTAQQWQVVAITTPKDRATGEPVLDEIDYLDESQAPRELVEAEPGSMTDFCVAKQGTPAGPVARSVRRAREGRPPSHWLLSLSADELSWWLQNVEPNQAGVSGMTYLKHLTEGHGFEPQCIGPLTHAEQKKLHGAVHQGY